MDVRFFYFLNDLAGQSRILDALVVFFAEYFQYFLLFTFFLLVYFSRYTKQQKLHVVGVTILSVVVARLGITEIIRFLYHRPRPFLTHDVQQLVFESAWSFPSGHAAFFFAMATAIYFYNKKWGVGFFLAAVLISISRIIASVHYPSDIIGGMLVGMLVGYGVFRCAQRIKPLHTRT